MRPIVHIGYHKTATTWFQQVYYPNARNRRYVPRRGVREHLVNPSGLRFDAGAARGALGLEADSIVCEEALCGHYETGGLNGLLPKEMAHRIRDVAPSAQIVIFVRRQPDFIVASYLQYLRRGGTFKPKRFLFPGRWDKLAQRKPFKKPLFDIDHYDYCHLVGLYQRLFGSDAVHVFPFERLVEDLPGFTVTYARRLGLDVDADALPRQTPNVSFRRNTARLARVINRLGASDVAHRHCSLAMIPKGVRIRALNLFNETVLAGDKVTPEWLFGEQTARWLGDYFREANTQLERMTGLELARYRYPLVADEMT